MSDKTDRNTDRLLWDSLFEMTGDYEGRDENLNYNDEPYEAIDFFECNTDRKLLYFIVIWVCCN